MQQIRDLPELKGLAGNCAGCWQVRSVFTGVVGKESGPRSLYFEDMSVGGGLWYIPHNDTDELNAIRMISRTEPPFGDRRRTQCARRPASPAEGGVRHVFRRRVQEASGGNRVEG